MGDNYQEITKNCNFTPSSKLKEAYIFAQEIHKDHIRYSGDNFIKHSSLVAIDIAKLRLDEPTVIAALLHNVIQTSKIPESELKAKFGDEIAQLVIAGAKVDQMTSESHLRFSDYEALKKLLISMTDDIRVLLIRIADRLNNMRTIEHLKPHRQITYCEETLNFYVPLAEYIGMGIWKRELEDISFKVISPDKYDHVLKLINKDPRSNVDNIEIIKKDLEELLKKNNIKGEVFGRIKSVSSTYKKIERKIKEGQIRFFDLTPLKDVVAFSIVIKSNNEIDCYRLLGLIHSNWTFSQADFSDYISNPKPNGYKSIHTVILYKEDQEIEIQIKTSKIHDYNEYGPASHIAYKISENKNAAPSKLFGWIKHLVKWKDEKKHDYKLDIFKNKIYVFTPRGKVIELPVGSTPIDFAYHIHTKIGNSCRGAKLNEKIVTLNTKLKTGDIVEILTDKKAIYPNKEWINIVKSATARNAIRKSLNDKIANQLLERGKVMLAQKALSRYGFNWQKLSSDQIEKIENQTQCELSATYRRIASRPQEALKFLGDVEALLKLTPIESQRVKKIKITASNIIFEDGTKYQYRLAKCCNPKSPEKIKAYLSQGFGVSIHKINCKELSAKELKDEIKVKWA